MDGIPIPQQFIGCDKTVCIERDLQNVPYPWDLTSMMDLIDHYSKMHDQVQKQFQNKATDRQPQLSKAANDLRKVGSELTQLSVVVFNGRRELKESRQHVAGGLKIAALTRRKRRIEKLLKNVDEFKNYLSRLECIRVNVIAGKFCDALDQSNEMQKDLSQTSSQDFPALSSLNGQLRNHINALKKRVSDGLRRFAVTADVKNTSSNAEKYEELLRAHMRCSNSGPVSSVLLQGLKECISEVSRQCVLAFVNINPDDGLHNGVNSIDLQQLCQQVPAQHSVACVKQLYIYFWEFLDRHHYLVTWHKEKSVSCKDDFQDNCLAVGIELASGRTELWFVVQKYVTLVLMALDLNYPSLQEKSFCQIVSLTNLLVDAEAKMATELIEVEGTTEVPINARNEPIRNTLRSKTQEYLQIMQITLLHDLLYRLQADSWERVKTLGLLSAANLKKKSSGSDTESEDGSTSSPRAASSNRNPFVEYALSEPSNTWQDEDDENIINSSSSLIEPTKNDDLIWSSATIHFNKVLEKYIVLMQRMPKISFELFSMSSQLIEMYVHTICNIFNSTDHVTKMLTEINVSIPDVNSIDPLHLQMLQNSHDIFLQFGNFAQVAESVARSRQHLSGIDNSFVALSPFARLSSQNFLCGLSERVVAVESCFAVLKTFENEKQKMRDLISLEPQKQFVDGFFEDMKPIVEQLKNFSYFCCAHDLLFVPDGGAAVGKVSLDHWSNTLNGLKWSQPPEKLETAVRSIAAVYVDQLVRQIEDLDRKITLLSNISEDCKVFVWREISNILRDECINVFASVREKMNKQMVQLLLSDFLELQHALEKVANNHHNDFSRLQNFVVALELSTAEFINYCKQNILHIPLKTMLVGLSFCENRDAGNPAGTPSSAVPGATQRANDLTLFVVNQMNAELEKRQENNIDF